MEPVDFLRTVWPDEGIYCIARPFQNKGMSKPVYAHKTFDKLEDAADYVVTLRGSHNIFFNVHTLRDHRVWNAQKENHKTGGKGAYEVRSQRNMKACKTLFWDLDVGEGEHKYASQAEALASLKAFYKTAKLPAPMVVSSGNGLHVYWLLDEALPTADWVVLEARLKQLGARLGVKVDPSRTTDMSSVLRVSGTMNRKVSSAPRPVDVITPLPAACTPASKLGEMLTSALVAAGEIPVPPQQPRAAAGPFGASNMTIEYDGPPVTAYALAKACALSARAMQTAATHSEPQWYQGVVGLLRFTENGNALVHKLSSSHPGYSQTDTDSKIQQHANYRDAGGNPLGPTSCTRLAQEFGNDLCLTCPFHTKVRSPLAAARFKDEAPAPIVSLAPNAPAVTLHNPPKPYIRLKSGGIAICAKDQDGNETNTLIYDYDLYPLRRLYDNVNEAERQTWRVELPHGGSKDFTVAADALYDRRRFVAEVCVKGIYPSPNNIPYLQEYMVAYISQLQRLAEAEVQSGHLGWTDDYKAFILPDKTLLADGTARPSSLGLGASRSSAQVHKKGTLKRQIELLRFYNHARYMPNQFMILAGLGSTLLHATGQHGAIVNASGDAGSSKSTTLYAAAAHWGNPKLFAINGTNDGATIKGRNERVTVLANLPICVDEVTHMGVKNTVDLAMGITQPGHRIRLTSEGVERNSTGSHKATIMLTTANSSLHTALAADNAAGTAGSMRVVEMRFRPVGVHSKAEADELLHDLEQNYGHLGEEFIAYCVQNIETICDRVRKMRHRVDVAARVAPSERYWSAVAAVVLVAGEIALQLKLLDYPTEPLFDWVVNKLIPEMRGIVVEEYSTPLSILTDYMEQINSDMIVTRSPQNLTHFSQDTGADVIRQPRGSLLAHYDLDYNQLWILKKAFSDHCLRSGANFRRIMDDLSKPTILPDGSAPRVITHRAHRKVLGSRTIFAKAQSWCFCVNMAHPDVSGSVTLRVIDGGKSNDGPGTEAAETTS